VGTYEDRAKLIWSLAGSGNGQGTTISAAGNSGTWGDTPTASYPSSPVSLSPATDFQLMVYAVNKTSSPTFTVQLGYYDDLGNLFTPAALLLTVTLSGSAPYQAQLNAGARAGSGGSSVYFAFPAWGQVSWSISGGTVTGANISLWGR
jgi:hypothetical protein